MRILCTLAALAMLTTLPVGNVAHAKGEETEESVQAAVRDSARQRRPRADHYDHYLQLGYTYGMGGPYAMRRHTGPTLAGLRFTERNGFVGRGTTNLLYVTLASMGVSDREYQGSTYTTIGSTTYRVDHYRMLSQEEIDAQYAAIEETSQALMGSGHDGFDFVFYHPAFGSDGLGFNTHIYFAGSRQFKDGRQRRAVFRFGIGGGYVRGDINDLEFEGSDELAGLIDGNDRWLWWSVSTPMQLHVNATPWLAIDWEWDLNWAALVYLVNGTFERRSATPGNRVYGDLRYAPMSLSATFDPIDYFYVRAGGHIGSLSLDGLGWSVEAGVRF